MNAFGCQLVDRLGIALLHSLWQGALVALVLFVVLCLMRQSRAQLRYVACCLALAAMVLFPMATFSLVRTHRPAADGTEGLGSSNSLFCINSARRLPSRLGQFRRRRPRSKLGRPSFP